MSNKDDACYLVEPAGAYIWKALLQDNPSGALAVMRVILSGNAAIIVHGLPSATQFTRADVYDEIKLRQFLEQKPYHHNVDSLLTKFPPTDSGMNLHRLLVDTTSNLDEEEKKKYLSLFFTNDRPKEKKSVELSEAKPPIPTGAVGDNLTDVYTDFLEKGKLLGISPVMMSIILPESTRQQLLMELLNKLQSQKSEGQ